MRVTSKTRKLLADIQKMCVDRGACKTCPYYDGKTNIECIRRKSANALAYIQHLEAANAELLTKVEQLEADVKYHKDGFDTLLAECEKLERERDALLKDIGSVQGCICIICKNYNNPDPGTGTAECNILGRFKDCGSDGALMCGQFKWRGVKEE